MRSLKFKTRLPIFTDSVLHFGSFIYRLYGFNIEHRNMWLCTLISRRTKYIYFSNRSIRLNLRIPAVVWNFLNRVRKLPQVFHGFGWTLKSAKSRILESNKVRTFGGIFPRTSSSIDKDDRPGNGRRIIRHYYCWHGSYFESRIAHARATRVRRCSAVCARAHRISLLARLDDNNNNNNRYK